ncbi:MAG TPA: MFS transporter [Candidatus Acidoferrales bacterium]|nr:MFS transporter [Candidatus Acidoferrales bacterium]
MSSPVGPDTTRADSSPSAPRHTWRPLSITLVVLCQSMQSLTLGGIALFLPLIRKDVGLSFTQAGSLAAASTFIYALMQIPSGYLADRIGARRLFLVGLAGCNLLALSLALLHSYWLIVLNQAVSGFFRSLVFAPGLILIGALFPPRRRATAMGLYVAGGFSSNILLNALGPVLVGPLGWRTLFIAFSVSGLLVLLLFRQLGAPGPRGSGSASLSPGQIWSLFRHRVMRAIAVIQFVRLAVASSIAFWLPTFIVVQKHQSLQVAGLVVALSAAVTAPSNFLGGYVSDRIGRPLAVVALSLAMLSATNILLVEINNLVALLAVVVVNGLFLQLYFGPLFSIPIAMLGQRAAGFASGYGNFFANLGGFTLVYVLGIVKDATGSFSVGFYALSGLCLGGLGTTYLLSRMAAIEIPSLPGASSAS